MQRKPPSPFDAAAFLAQHWRDVFGPLFKRLNLDPDAPIGERVAISYHVLLQEQTQLDGAAGPAFKRAGSSCSTSLSS